MLENLLFVLRNEATSKNVDRLELKQRLDARAAMMGYAMPLEFIVGVAFSFAPLLLLAVLVACGFVDGQSEMVSSIGVSSLLGIVLWPFFIHFVSCLIYRVVAPRKGYPLFE